MILWVMGGKQQQQIPPRNNISKGGKIAIYATVACILLLVLAGLVYCFILRQPESERELSESIIEDVSSESIIEDVSSESIIEDVSSESQSERELRKSIIEDELSELKSRNKLSELKSKDELIVLTDGKEVYELENALSGSMIFHSYKTISMMASDVIIPSIPGQINDNSFKSQQLKDLATPTPSKSKSENELIESESKNKLSKSKSKIMSIESES
jgi:hypothetical protein